eukprot:11821441-Alexandrium_andersonii.AAC.1
MSFHTRTPQRTCSSPSPSRRPRSNRSARVHRGGGAPGRSEVRARCTAMSKTARSGWEWDTRSRG